MQQLEEDPIHQLTKNLKTKSSYSSITAQLLKLSMKTWLHISKSKKAQVKIAARMCNKFPSCKNTK